MKFTGALSALLLVLPIAVQAAPGAMQARNHGFGFQKGGQGQVQGGKGGNQNKGGNNAGKGGNNNAGKGNAGGAANNGTAAAGGNNNNNAGKGNAGGAANNGTAAAGGNNNAGNANNNNNPQTSLTLDPSVICTNCAQTGQGSNGTEAGQVASATSTNNFINFCVGKTVTNGLQVQTGSCNPIPQGNIPAKTSQPSCKFSFPTNFGNIAQANTAFTIKMNIANLQTGAFVNPQTNYFAAPQDLNGQGIIIGHSHVTVQALNSITDTQPIDPQKFVFFLGLNAAAQGGALNADVTKGLDAGAYRLCSINTDANHTPVLGPVAQHGSFDDCVYFTVGAQAQQQALKDIGAAGAANNNNNNNAGAAASAASGAAASNSTAAAGAAASSAAAAGGNKGGNNAGNANKGGNANAGKGQQQGGAKNGQQQQGGAKNGQQQQQGGAKNGQQQQGGAKNGQQQQGGAKNGQQQQGGAKQGQQAKGGKNGRRFNISRQN